MAAPLEQRRHSCRAWYAPLRCTVHAVQFRERYPARFMPARPLVLYSTNTWLAYSIAERYYRGEHYVWCTPYFSPRSLPPYGNMPPTSCPSEIYQMLDREVRAGDRHSSKIGENRTAIMKAAALNGAAGIIGEQDVEDITAIVNRAETRDFHPLVYVIPFDLAEGVLPNVPVSDRAHPLAAEYVLKGLRRECFDVIDFG